MLGRAGAWAWTTYVHIQAGYMFGVLQTGFVKYPSHPFLVGLELVPERSVRGSYPRLFQWEWGPGY